MIKTHPTVEIPDDEFSALGLNVGKADGTGVGALVAFWVPSIDELRLGSRFRIPPRQVGAVEGIQTIGLSGSWLGQQRLSIPVWLLSKRCKKKVGFSYTLQ
jgi:hypothetical protein